MLMCGERVQCTKNINIHEVKERNTVFLEVILVDKIDLTDFSEFSQIFILMKRFHINTV